MTALRTRSHTRANTSGQRGTRTPPNLQRRSPACRSPSPDTSIRPFSTWRRVPQAPGAIDLPDDEAQHRDDLYLTLGGDLGDGLAAAGRRLCSRMWSARIADGFVHPAVGAYLWNDNSGINGGVHAEVGGPLICALYAIGDMWGRWWREPQHRSDIEREITGYAQNLGWI